MTRLTLPEMLRRSASDDAKRGITYFGDDGTAVFLSYAELLEEASALSCGLRADGMKAGDFAVIATENNRETITLLWACFLAGIVPTVLQPPVSWAAASPSAAKLFNVFRQLDQPRIFTSHFPAEASPEIKESISVSRNLRRLEGETVFTPMAGDLAFIQFSSGSTGDPKGIELTHHNLAVNLESIIIGLDMHPHDPIGSWMPLYHDMGLIGYHLTPLSRGCNQYHIHTTDYIKNPSLWPEMMSRYRISITGCPNFGQELLLRYLKRRPEGHAWDLSAMKAMLNGAEPISVKVMSEFNQALKPFGFREEAMMPVYGMAEATLAISFSPLMQPSVVKGFDGNELDRNQQVVPVVTAGHSRQARMITSVGLPLQNTEIRITDAQDNPLPKNHAGHIQVRGGAITRGYFRNPEASRELFCGDWLRTGDMGFSHEGLLYISGRFKDIIFVNGKNYFANDLETIACTLDDLTYGKTIAGGYTDFRTGKEKVLVFAAGIGEARAPETLERLRVLMRKEGGVPVDELILIRSADIPRTSSGKIQRYKIMQRYHQGDFAGLICR
jgi:acyl-CoA synthetase (AMP-forming)/AMP-acid ligase II